MTTDTPSFTPVQKVLRYYPQRVQVLVLALLNLVFGGLEEFTIVAVSSGFVGLVNTFALAILVFFYGEPRTASKGGIEDGLVELPSQEPFADDV